MIHIKNFSNNHQYDNLNLELQQGTTCALIGDNGLGKSLLTRYLIGLYNNYQGEIIINNQLLTDDNYQKVQQDIGLIFQNPYNQFCGETVLDEIIFHMQMNQEIDIDILLKQYDQNYLNTKLRNLSYGEAVNLLINNFITTNKKIIICDEVITALDEQMKQKIFNKIKEKNITLLYITNNRQDCQYADISYELKNKQLKQYIYQKNKITLLENTNQNYQQNYKYGINVIQGIVSSGKTTTLKKIHQKQKNTFLIMQTPLLQINTDIVYNYLKQYNHTFKQYIKMFNLDMSILDKSMFELSTGQLITVMIIAYIISDKDVLLIDEGFEVISLSTRTKILDILETKDYQIITTTKNIEIYNNRRINLINI
jgi:energy-coupling factor transport system ATP-binding protein